MIPDDNQPIIIEDTQQLPKKQIRPSTNEMFFAVLDELELYDQHIAKVNKLHEEASLSFAHLKFINPFTSVHQNGLKCLPAFATVCPSIEEVNGFKIEYGYVDFKYQIDPDLEPIEHEEQESIEAECKAKNEARTALKKQSEEEQEASLEIIKDEEVLYRFRVLNQTLETIDASQKYHRLLHELLALAAHRQKILERFVDIENRMLK